MEEKVIGGRYVCKKSLGKGGSGSVFLCYDMKLQKEWAVKELKIPDAMRVEAEERMNGGKSSEEAIQTERSSELELLKTISCNQFPRIVDVIHEQKKVYLVMDYVEGITLKEKMQRQKLTEKEVLLWAVEIAKALRYLHQMSPQILYMDCKPENIILTPQGEIRLVDLGSVYICHSEQKQRISGTRFFAPKEQQSGGWTKRQNGERITRQNGERTTRQNGGGEEQKPDIRSDIYAFGMTLYYLLVGKKKIYRRTGRLCVKEGNPKVSDGLSAIIARCTEIDPKDRYQSMDEVLYQLAHIKEAGKQEKTKNCLRKVIAMLGKCICVCVILGGAWAYAKWNERPVLIGALAGVGMFFFLCRRRGFTIYEVKKEVFCGSGKRVLLYLIIVLGVLRIMTVSVFAEESKVKGMADDQEKHAQAGNTESKVKEQKLEVTVYDWKGRKLLLKDDTVWTVSEDILLAIPIEELEATEGKITLLYEDKESGDAKKYEFSCRRK